MKTLVTTVALTLLLVSLSHAYDARPQYEWMTGLHGDWVLSPASQQEGKATHYCVKQNQPEMLLNPSSKAGTLTFNCDMNTALCQSQQDHIHTITHELSSDKNHLVTAYTSWKGGKYAKDSVYHFERK